jgi:hypothetical protein
MVAVARADGSVHDEEARVVNSWVEWRVENSHWGGLYTEPKLKALVQLAGGLRPSDSDISNSLETCAKEFSGKQRTAFLRHVDEMESFAGAAGARLAVRIRAALKDAS